ncbi:MAG: Uma2 family endonuclease, partial [Myxococcota bacterium]
LATYPDLTVVCGAVERHPDDADAITNPTAVFEVLSDSTEGWDRGGKFRHLGAAPSLRHYVLVSQDPRSIEVYTRTGEQRWELVRLGPGQTAELGALGIALDVDRVYRNLPPEP